MTANDLFESAFEKCPLVAIIRGVTPGECVAIGEALYEGGIRIIEVPLNSPEPLESIKRLSERFDDGVLIGAGTVLRVEQVEQVKQAGGRLIVSPGVNGDVIGASVAAGLVSCPVFHTIEAFTPLKPAPMR